MSLDYRNQTAKRSGEIEGLPIPCGDTLRDNPTGIQARLSLIRDRLVDIRTGIGNSLDRITGSSPEVSIAKENCHDTVLNLISSIEDITGNIHSQVKVFHETL